MDSAVPYRYAPYVVPSRKPLPSDVVVMLRQRKKKPMVPIPPNNPFFDNNLQGPSSKKLAIPLAADITEIENLAKKKVLKVRPSKCSCPVINFGS